MFLRGLNHIKKQKQKQILVLIRMQISNFKLPFHMLHRNYSVKASNICKTCRFFCIFTLKGE